MGGGGAMRAAAKVAGIRVASGARRGAGEGARPASAIVSSSSTSSEEVKSGGGVLTASLETNNAIDAAATVQRPCWELDDWEFAGGAEDNLKSCGEPMPRLVFGGAPTLQEAKEATEELKDALEKAYLTSPHSTECGDLLVPGHQYPFSLLSKPDYSETKACITSEKTAGSLPNNALKAFRLLNESPAAQNVVASIASDPNVWTAVLQNEALTEFLESQKSTASFSKMDPAVEGSVTDSEFTDNQSPKPAYEFNDSGKSGDSENGFMGFVKGLKIKVNDMMSSLSDYFQSLFGGPTEEKVSGDADARPPFGEKAMGASLLGLAVMVIMVVVLKRV
ncbi:uncharacterized protein LOC131321597 [Rhododendron vialii]|uniref:uncharacterized protein LOC131321597 n=1 Tax=Rhododendron vialii TaxID=182163 RepID=UPI00265D9C39|nr:uncharacterized protein LOC131321597 [Rhododendron vialii]